MGQVTRMALGTGPCPALDSLALPGLGERGSLGASVGQHKCELACARAAMAGQLRHRGHL